MEIFFVYPMQSYWEYTKMYVINKVRVPNVGDHVYYRHDKFKRIGRVSKIMYDYAAMTINIYLDEEK